MSSSESPTGSPPRWRRVLENAAALLALDHVRLVAFRKGRFRILATAGPDAAGPRDSRLSARAESREAVRAVEDFGAEPEWRDAPETAEGWGSGLAAPISGGGALIAFRRAPGPFSPEARVHLGHLAEWAAADGVLDAAGSPRSPSEFPLADRVAEMADRIRDIYFEVGLDGVIRDVSPAAEAVAGVSRERLIGRPAVDFYEDPKERGRFLEVVLREGSVTDYPVVLRDGEGRPRHFSVSAFLETDAAGLPRRVAGALRDIAEQKKQEAEPKAARRAAEKSGRAKSHFLADMSRAIRTPMNTVIDMIELALDDDLPPHPREMLETARVSADGLRALLDDILDLSKIEAGQLAPEIAEFSPARLIADVARALEPRARRKGLELRTDLAPNLPGRFRGAPRRLRQVLNNLVGNALKFTRTGGVTVTAGLDAEAKSNPEGSTALRFAVCDTGPGIPADQLDRVFDAFSRGDDADRRRFEGAGLGATISRELVKAMGGELTVESRLGKGSTFVFTIRGEARGGAGAEKNGEPPLDREGLLDIVGGTPRIARELVRLYLQNSPELMEKVRRAVEAADAGGLKEAAHALKGMSLNLSAGPVAEASLRLERLGRSEDPTRAAREFQTLEKEMARLREELDIFLETLEAD
jgi:PAS domain S-box-containing protein